jgi:hypothetical protein
MSCRKGKTIEMKSPVLCRGTRSFPVAIEGRGVLIASIGRHREVGGGRQNKKCASGFASIFGSVFLLNKKSESAPR